MKIIPHVCCLVLFGIVCVYQFDIFPKQRLLIEHYERMNVDHLINHNALLKLNETLREELARCR